MSHEVGPDPAMVLGPLLRAVQRDKPIPDAWREPLVELVAWLLGDPHEKTRGRACHVILEMNAANIRLEQRVTRHYEPRQKRTPTGPSRRRRPAI